MTATSRGAERLAAKLVAITMARVRGAIVGALAALSPPVWPVRQRLGQVGTIRYIGRRMVAPMFGLGCLHRRSSRPSHATLGFLV